MSRIFQAYKRKTEAAKKEYLKALAAYRASLVSKVTQSPGKAPMRVSHWRDSAKASDSEWYLCVTLGSTSSMLGFVCSSFH